MSDDETKCKTRSEDPKTTPELKALTESLNAKLLETREVLVKTQKELEKCKVGKNKAESDLKKVGEEQELSNCEANKKINELNQLLKAKETDAQEYAAKAVSEINYLEEKIEKLEKSRGHVEVNELHDI